MSPTERKNKEGISRAQLNASVSPIWPKERMCWRTLDVMLDGKSHSKLLERAKENCEKMGKKAPIAKEFASLPESRFWSNPQDVLKPDPGLIDQTVYRREYGDDMVLGRGVVVGGYRFTPSTCLGFHMRIEKLEKGKVISKSVCPKTGETLKIKDGEKTITISLYGGLEPAVLEGVYIKVE